MQNGVLGLPLVVRGPEAERLVSQGLAVIAGEPVAAAPSAHQPAISPPPGQETETSFTTPGIRFGGDVLLYSGKYYTGFQAVASVFFAQLWR
jgi:hypothetical protein